MNVVSKFIGENMSVNDDFVMDANGGMHALKPNDGGHKNAVLKLLGLPKSVSDAKIYARAKQAKLLRCVMPDNELWFGSIEPGNSPVLTRAQKSSLRDIGIYNNVTVSCDCKRPYVLHAAH